jgi:UDP-N-acetylmuramoyl-tripeptide--D-alanyl-D-alanine ligase
MSMGLKLSEVLAFSRGRWFGRSVSELIFTGVSTDSRSIRPGELFVAIKGDTYDGNDYVEAALKAGALAAISDRQGHSDRPVIEVKNSLKALAEMARHVRRQKGFKVLAVTGSVGKTTVKEMVKSILVARNRLIAPNREILATRGNFNNEIGLPLTILESVKMQQDPTDAVLEMGASAPGEIRYLTEIARPDVGLVTAIGPAHLEKFKDLETLAKTKGELLRNMDPGCLAVVNKSDPLMVAQLVSNSVNTLFYGPGGQVWLKENVPHGFSGQTLTFGGPAVNDMKVELPLVGEHNAFNAVAAVAAAIAMDCGQLEIKQGLSQIEALDGRLKPIHTDLGYWVIDDSYNANPASVEAGLNYMASIEAPGIKGAILGDMLELGSEAKTLHQDMGRSAAEHGLDFLAIVGSMARQTLSGARTAGNRRIKLEIFSAPEEAADWARGLLDKSGFVLVKGSRAGALERAVSRLQEK